MNTPSHISTLGDWRDPAIICKERGWKVGTRIAGNEGYGVTVITITAIGEKQILARVDGSNSEHSWTLQYRDWKLTD